MVISIPPNPWIHTVCVNVLHLCAVNGFHVHPRPRSRPLREVGTIQRAGTPGSARGSRSSCAPMLGPGSPDHITQMGVILRLGAFWVRQWAASLCNEYGSHWVRQRVHARWRCVDRASRRFADGKIKFLVSLHNAEHIMHFYKWF